MTKQINLKTKSKQWAKQQEMVKIYSSPFYLATAQFYYLTIIGREGAYIYTHFGINQTKERELELLVSCLHNQPTFKL